MWLNNFRTKFQKEEFGGWLCLGSGMNFPAMILNLTIYDFPAIYIFFEI